MAGFITGFIYGVVVYVIILAASDWCSVSGMLGIGIFSGLFGLLLSCYTREKLIETLALSLVGSWVFVRSASIFFGGLPEEGKIWKMIIQEDEVNFPQSFWYYVVLFYATILVTSVFNFPEQSYRGEDGDYLRV